MMNEYVKDRLLREQHEINKKLLEVQKRTPYVSTSTKERQPPVNEPVYDLYWQQELLHLKLELPGVSEENITVDLTPNYLRITGKVNEIKNREQAEFLISKCKQGPFEYLLNLPTPQMMTTRPPELKNGVLYIQLKLNNESEENR